MDPAVIEPRRNLALDGLRGAAALVVVIHHTLLISPSLSRVYTSARPSAFHGALMRALAFSPIHIVWAGGEAVFVFFVLSGYVLARPHIGARSTNWSRYYGKRLVRLYLPVWGALVIAVALVHVVSHTVVTGGSDWLNLHTGSFTVESIRDDALLLFQPGRYTTVLWSLRYEVVFSLLLPAFVVFGRIARRAAFGCVVVIIAAMASAGVTDLMFLYLPMFAVGTALAFTESHWRPRLSPWLQRTRRVGQAGTLLVAVVLLCARWLVYALPQSVISGRENSQWVVVPTTMAATLGAAILVVLVIAGGSVAHVLQTRPMQWLGSRSYSIYLVHEPIVVCTAFITKGWSWPGAIGAIALALGLSELFFRLVERPSIALAARCGAAAERLAA